MNSDYTNIKAASEFIFHMAEILRDKIMKSLS